MEAQGISYLSKNLNISSDRYANLNNNRNTRLGDRTITSNSVDGKRYYSSLDAEIYIGDRFIDNVVQIQWAMEQAAMPLFGYNSYTFDDIAVGARQISGSFMINFTKSGFMYDVLRSVQGVSRSVFYTENDLNSNKRLNWSSYFEKEHTAAWDKGFNIRIGYGDSNMGGKDTTMQVLYCVQLTGYQQALSINGDVIGEIYTFIAKDIRYDVDLLPEKIEDDDESKDTTENKTNDTFSFSVSNPRIIRKKIPHNISSIQGDQSGGDYYVIEMNYSIYNGDLTKFEITLKDLDGNSIVPVAIEAEVSKEKQTIKVYIPSKYTIQIDRVFKILDNKYIYCDYTVNYNVDNKEMNPIEKTNLKLQLEENNAQ